jgi:hypothetical protein
MSRKLRFGKISAPVPGANPTIASYNASVVNFYNATGFEKKNNLLLLKAL